MASTLKKTSFWAVYVVVIVAVVGVVTEVSVRALGLAPKLDSEYGNMVPDPYLPYKPRPNSKITGRSKYDEFDYDIQVNSVGFRDFERPYKKPEGVFRVLGLGDSFTYGGAALFEQTYLRTVERMLNERTGDHPPVEVIKAGVPRYYPETQRMMLEHYGVRYEPDVVTVGFVANDVLDTYQGLDAVTVHESGYLHSREADRIGTLGTFLYMNSHLARTLLDRYIKAQKHRPMWDEVYKADGLYEAQWKEVEAEYEKMAEITRSIGAALVILYIPDFTLFKRGPERHYPPQRLAAWAKRNGATFVDATPAMLEAGETSSEPLYYTYDYHCTPAGYKVVAEHLYDSLIEKNLVP